MYKIQNNSYLQYYLKALNCEKRINVAWDGRPQQESQDCC